MTTNCFLFEHIFLFFFKTHLLAAFNIHSEYLSVYSSTEMVAFLFNKLFDRLNDHYVNIYSLYIYTYIYFYFYFFWQGDIHLEKEKKILSARTLIDFD